MRQEHAAQRNLQTCGGYACRCLASAGLEETSMLRALHSLGRFLEEGSTGSEVA